MMYGRNLPKKAESARKRFKLEQLEPRTLYSADTIAAGISTVGFSSDDDFTEPDLLIDYSLLDQANGFEPLDDVAPEPAHSQQSRFEIVFIDEATPDYNVLIQDLLANISAERTFEIITIAQHEDGLRVVTDTLANYTDVSAVHLISHGSDGIVNIGNTALSQSTLPTYQNAISKWSDAFTEGGDLLIYGCDFSATDSGIELGANIASLAQVDVASSDDRTGGSEVSGDWVLEQMVGTVETTVPFSKQLQDTYHRSLVNSITVTTTADSVDGDTSSFDALALDPGTDGSISLREAIQAANTQTGADTINLPTGTYINSFAGSQDIFTDVIIKGDGAGTTVISGLGSNDRVIEVYGGGILELQDVSIADGSGGIHNEGILTTNNVVIENNVVGNAQGGAVLNEAIANFNNTTFSSNIAQNAGAVYTSPSAITTITNSILIDNTASSGGGGGLKNEGITTVTRSLIKDNHSRSNGGGFTNDAGHIDIINSTVTGNTVGVSASGGGLFNKAGTAYIQYSTFTENLATNTGGGIDEHTGAVTISSSIIANNTINQPWASPDIQDLSVSDGHNIIGSTSNTGSFAPHAQDQFGVDPLLLAFDNTTNTHPLDAASPAIDQGGPTTITVDQTGTSRDASPDVGAVEYSSSAPVGPNQAPSIGLTLNTEVIDEDTPLPFSTATANPITISDDNPGSNLALTLSVTSGTITFAPSPGAANTTLSFTGTQAAINAELEKLLYTPNADFNGTDTLTVLIEDQDPTGNLSTTKDVEIIVQPVSDAPTGTDTALTANEDSPIAIKPIDFGFLDGDNDNFTAVVISILPANGTLTLAGAAVTANQTISVTNIAAGDLVYTPVADQHGVPYAGLDFQVQDSGSTNNGGLNLDQSANTLNFNYISVSDAPTAGDNTIATFVNTPVTLAPAYFNFSDPQDGDNFSSVTITSLPSQGSLLYANVPVAVNQVITVPALNIGALVFTPALNQNGTAYDEFNFRVNDGGSTNLGGLNQSQQDNTITFDVLSVNSAPTGTDNLISTNEDTPITIKSSDFGFSDPDADFLAAVTITSLPVNGTLKHANNTVSVGQLISVTSINSGELVFTPGTDDNGTAYANFDFKVHDNGGTANGGTDQDPTPNTITIDVLSVNDAPQGSDNTVNIVEDTPYAITAADFGYSDIADGDNFDMVALTTPTNGTLTFSGSPINSNVGTYVLYSKSDFDNGNIVYTPAPGANGLNHDTLSFRVYDDGGTLNGGDRADQTLRSLTFNVSNKNNAPDGTDSTITLNEDTSTTIQSTHFGFSDTADGDAFAAVTITTLPANGALTLAGSDVSAGQLISITDINNGNLRFTPTLNENGSIYTDFAFQVHDNGGTANGGVDQDQIPNTVNLNVLAVNDPPQGIDNTIGTNEDTPLTLTLANFTFSDIEGNPLSAVIVSPPADGTLALAGITVAQPQAVSAAEISNGDLVFTPSPDSSATDYTSIPFLVRDSGGTINSGTDLDQQANNLIIDVLPVNDAPAGADTAISTNEDVPIILTSTNFGFTDLQDQNSLQEVLITSVAGGGTLTVDGATITTPATIDVTDIDSGLLVFTSDSDTNGTGVATIDFRVRDNGDTTNGGQDTSAVTNAITVSIDAVNDAPYGSDATYTLLEDSSRVLSLADLGYSDPSENHAFSNAVLTTAPLAGQLTLSGTPLVPGDLIPLMALNNGDVVYVPAAGASGTAYDSFSFQVQDTGGTASGGQDTDQTPATLTLNVTPVSDAPSGSDKLISIDEDTDHTFALSDFGFTDTAEESPDQFQSLKITQLPVTGVLLNNGASVSSGQSISTADILAGMFVYSPSPHAFGQAFDNMLFRVTDSGNTANGGENLDQTDNQILFDINNISDAPIGTDNITTINEDTPYSLKAEDFGFSDANDGDYFAAITVVDLPDDGTLTLSGDSVTSNQTISITDISNGDLVYAPAANESGNAYADLTFLVHDTGTIANGGQNISPNLYTAAFNVVSLNDAPIGIDSTRQVTDNTSHTLTAADFTFSDTENHSLQSVKIESLPATGLLTLNSAPVIAGDTISASDLAAGALVYQPVLNTAFQSDIGFTVTDTGGTANGGADTQVTPALLTLTTLAVNDPPTADDQTLTINEDSTHVFDVADFGYSDPAEQHGFKEVVITAISGSGTLSLNGAAITTITTVPVTAISNGQLAFTPASDAFGTAYAAFDFQVVDDGGTANGGQDTSPTNTFTIDVMAVSDAPTAQSATITIDESSQHTFKTIDFGFADPVEDHALQSVLIDQVPSAGTLLLNGTTVAAGQSISAVDVTNGSVAYQPDAGLWGLAYDTIQFRIQDDGGSTNGGQDTSTPSEAIIFNVTEVNSAPSGTDNVIAIDEHEIYTFSSTDFGFSDSTDNHSLSSVIIQTVDVDGVLQNNGQLVTTGTEISVTDINAGLLTFEATILTGADQIGFMVRDNGNPLNGDTVDQSENLITFDLNPINDPPELLNTGATFSEGSSDNLISTTVLAATDPDDPVQDLQFTLKMTPEHGLLTLNGTTLDIGDTFTMPQLTNNELQYSHNGAEASTDHFDFSLIDGGEDGVVPVTARFNIDITEVIDPLAPLPDSNLTLTAGNSFDSTIGNETEKFDSTLLDRALLGPGEFEIEIIEQPSRGVLTLNPDGSFLYAHDGSSHPTDSFTYQVTNYDGATSIATVNVTIEPDLDFATDFPNVVVPEAQIFTIPEPESVIEAAPEPKAETVVAKDSTNETPSEATAGALEKPTDEQLFSAESLTSNTLIDEQLDSLVNASYNEFEIQSDTLAIERELLRTLGVQQHNDAESIYLFEAIESSRVSISSINIQTSINSSLSGAVNNSDFLRGLSRAQGDLESSQSETRTKLQLGNDVAVTVSISTTAGILAWMLRGGAIFGSLMAATPLWASIDPFRITDSKKETEDSESSAVEEMFQ